jgi:hypothetical protein
VTGLAPRLMLTFSRVILGDNGRTAF